MKNRGFTLVELLVTIVVLGIIMGLSFPVIRHVQEENNKKKYETYAEGMMTSARLYVDSYDEDLFGHHDTGCAYITYQELVERKLLKDVVISDMSCDSDNTFVRVVKLKDQYGYAYSLGCGKKETGKVENPTVLLPEESAPKFDTDICKGREGSNIRIKLNRNDSYARRKKSQVVLTSATGIHGNIVMYSTWVKGENNRPSDDAEWKRVNFQVPGKQEETILGGDIIEVTSEDIISPAGDGDFYLWIRVEELKDIYGEKWKNEEEEEGKYVHIGPFHIDNTPPVCTLEGTSNVWTTGSRTIEWGCKDVGEGAGGCRKPNDAIGEMDERYGTYTFPNNKEKEKSRNMYTREQYVITDVAGNKTTCPTESVSIKIDNDNPTCEQSGSSTVWTNKNRTIKWGCRDNESGCAIGWSGGETTFSTTTKQANIPAYTIRDNVGHEVKCPIKEKTNIYVDKIAPVCTNSGDSTSWTTGNRNITWGCSDADSKCDPKASGGNTNFTTPTKTAVIPSYTIRDIAGNQTVCPVRTANVYADQVGPTITVRSNPLSLGNQDYTFTSNVTITPGISGIKTALACTPATSKKTGSYTVSCSATSIAGKTTPVTFTARHSYAGTPYCTNGGSYSNGACHYTRNVSICGCQTYNSGSGSVCGNQYCVRNNYGPLCRCSGSCGAHIMRCGDTCCGDGSPSYVADPNYNYGCAEYAYPSCQHSSFGCAVGNSCSKSDANYLKYSCPSGGTPGDGSAAKPSRSTCYY